MNDERDIRDAALEALLRAHSTESPPPAVDAAVLAAAHRAVDGEPRARPARATQPWRWWMPLAAAAAIGVVVIGIFPLAPTIVEPTPPAISDAPTAAAAPPSAGRQPIDAARPDAQGPVARVTSPGADRLSVKGDDPVTRDRAATAAKATVVPSRAEPKVEREGVSASAPPPAEQQRRAKATGAIGAIPQAAPPPQAAASPQAPQATWAQPPPQQGGAPAAAPPARALEASPRADAMKLNRQEVAAVQPRTADEWIARIRTLRSEDRLPDAIRALADFRAAFDGADTLLPQDLRDWAKTVR